MKKVLFLAITIVGFSLQGVAQDKKQLDKESIKDMCGCFKVNFKYTETFAPEIDYEKHLDYTSGALEWAELIEDENNKLSIQHLLVIKDTMVIKHWRQDWLYENNRVFHYDKDNKWVFTELPKNEVKGQWTQLVYQVDDSPRYSGSATWIHTDGKNYWENKSDSPLPRREYSKRSDYNVMARGNRQEITDYGWLHEQDNDKIIRETGKKDVLLAHEKGYNTYVRVPDEQCKAAKDWWKNNKKFWAKVRSAWNKVYTKNSEIELAKAVDKKPLFMHFYELEKKNANEKEILALIQKFASTKTTENAPGK
ncbi:DUF6607 family protein [Cellulophaga lytica]|uniref:DUF6607 family protein n=1 Tax=Cellulophaga lytica TaxID=979 RepID=UPI000B5C23CA|nr:DUF6607 family protein [Cellulophaga lytica]SNQ42367.1 Conserved hypothetical periplasmic protein [Cellulophaga lytica]